MKKDLLWFFVRVLIGFIFAYAGFTKLMSPMENFRGMIASYEVFPYEIVPAIAMALPWIEFILGSFLILGYAPRLSFMASAALALGFLLVLGASNAILEGGGKDCGCFGENSPIRLTVHQVFFMDLTIFFLSLKLSRVNRHFFSLDSFLSKS